ncbi:MAG: hypothetical protein MUF32_03555, partial [Burkholderiaceae bacterium]|nr:hypothetical protein [Burkholderiaceae bacterium]
MDPPSVPADWYLNPAVWSYGFATLGFAAFAVQLSIGWKGGGRALLLLASVTLSVFWAATTVAFALEPNWPMWRLAHALDTLRLACAVSFLAVVLLYSCRAGTARGGLPAFALILAPTALVLLSGMPPPGIQLEGSAPTLIFGSHLALALVGVVLAEQVYRHSPSTLRWNLRPLCIGLAG